MADKVKKAMKDLANNKSRSANSGNRTNPKDAKAGSDSQHGQTDVKKAKKKGGRPPKATR